MDKVSQNCKSIGAYWSAWRGGYKMFNIIDKFMFSSYYNYTLICSNSFEQAIWVDIPSRYNQRASEWSRVNPAVIASTII